MLRLTTVLAAAFLASLTTQTLAQDAEAPAEPATEEAAPADTQFDLGDPVEEVTQPGQPYIRDTFGDWALRCLLDPEGPDPCQMYQLLLNEDQTPVAEISIVPLAPGGDALAGVIVVVPLETQLTQQLTLSIDGGQARRYPYDFCNTAGCIARFGLSPEQVAQFKRGAQGTLTIVPAAAPDQRINLRMSLTGFTAGFDATQTPPE
ncbi:invasion associated locus B family protein [Flavimaricola marinus]|uniref:Invasion associated locus B (IalB) protein n=1 Tax=Flavimaricola marinus TaxID=1819565 RepID=A0A238LCU6_9RHOB|nr:invasion associated locus B family protein [Flavimaricola marinus]SMY07509.1 Invasion associated locus B (IalB) protein [Flavimaricola marinus]